MVKTSALGVLLVCHRRIAYWLARLRHVQRRTLRAAGLKTGLLNVEPYSGRFCLY